MTNSECEDDGQQPKGHPADDHVYWNERAHRLARLGRLMALFRLTDANSAVPLSCLGTVAEFKELIRLQKEFPSVNRPPPGSKQSMNVG